MMYDIGDGVRELMADTRPIPASAIKLDLPDVVQTKGYTCGAAALLAICRYYGIGPRSERGVVEDMRFGKAGSDPKHVLRAVAKYGLAHEEFRPMTTQQLRACLDRGHPVMVMLQAWADPPPRSYADDWEDGHWIVAIGYDAKGSTSRIRRSRGRAGTSPTPSSTSAGTTSRARTSTTSSTTASRSGSLRSRHVRSSDETPRAARVPYNTDGQVFSDLGVPVVLFMENYDISRTGYHDTLDTMANIDLDYCAAMIAIESVADAAAANALSCFVDR